MSGKQKILVMAHAHPDFSLGGGEIAAYNLFKAYKNCPDVDDAWYLGRADRGRGNAGFISVRRENEYLWEQGISDWHLLKAAHQESVTTWFADLIRALKPTVVHSHHYAHLGLEYFRVIKSIDPNIRIYLTLHEYMAICKNNGQMIKVGGQKLCSRESFDDCRMCFPEKTVEDFWLRKHFFMSHFDLIDGFFAPSEFLRQRYIAWGIHPDRIVVLENGQADHEQLPVREIPVDGKRNRFGFFGQINPFKGLDVVLRALSSMTKAQRKELVVEVHGANLEWQSADFQAKIEELRQPLIKEGTIQWVGPYQPHELPARMAGVDWTLVPSVWWENSPMVIQEAFTYGRPVIASDIGGMAEKVTHGVDGISVPTGNPLAWQSVLLDAATNVDKWEKLRAGIRKPVVYDECARSHLPYLEARFG